MSNISYYTPEVQKLKEELEHLEMLKDLGYLKKYQMLETKVI